MDGYTHQFDETFKNEQIKQSELEKVGLTVLRFSDEEVLNNLEGVILKINTPLDPLSRGEEVKIK